MKARFCQLWACCVAAAALSAAPGASAEQTVRVLSYNVRNCRGLDGPGLDVGRTAGVITSLVAEVVALQELDRGTRRSEGRDLLMELAAATGMTGTFGAAIPFQGGAYGVGVLSRQPPLRTHAVPLPGREEARVLLVCEFEAFALFCTHLSLTAESRLASVAIINRERDAVGKPVLLAGDFNDVPESECLRALSATWTRVSALQPTYPADKPERVIDYIFISNVRHAQAVEAAVVAEPAASDHRPVLSVVRFAAMPAP